MSAVASADEGVEPAVHVPEPMVFDLVRGLGAKRGEFEINVLSQFPLNKTSSRAIEWAPEIEYAVHDGIGLELELPFADGHVAAYKLAAQVTFTGLHRRSFLHGVQVIAEKVRGTEGMELTAIYVPVVTFHEHASVVTMIGMRAEVGGEARDETLLLNSTLFVEPNRETAAGVEINLAAPREGKTTLLLMPQFYRELDSHWTIQVGVGAELLAENRPQWTAALRLIWGTEGHPGPHPSVASKHAVRRK